MIFHPQMTQMNSEELSPADNMKRKTPRNKEIYLSIIYHKFDLTLLDECSRSTYNE